MKPTDAEPAVLHLYNVLGAATEQTWLHLAQGLGGRGYAVSAVCETLAGDPPPGLVVQRRPRVEVESGGDVEAEMNRLAEAEPPDPVPALVHGHFGPRVLHAAPYLGRGVPTVISLYGYDASRLLRDPAWGARYRWAAARGATFVVLADVLRDRLIADAGLPAEAVRVIRLGVDLKDWAYAPGPGPTPPRFVFVGRFTEKKGVATLLEAIEKLPGMGLDLIGQGPLEQTLRERVDALGIAGRVAFLGPLTREQIRVRLGGVTALVAPSVVAADGDAEGTPIVLMEAQAVGLPVVTTRHAGNPEVLPPGAEASVVEEHDAAGLAAAMSAVAGMSREDRQRRQAAGRACVERRFDLRQTVEAYAALYRERLGSGG